MQHIPDLELERDLEIAKKAFVATEKAVEEAELARQKEEEEQAKKEEEAKKEGKDITAQPKENEGNDATVTAENTSEIKVKDHKSLDKPKEEEEEAAEEEEEPAVEEEAQLGGARAIEIVLDEPPQPKQSSKSRAKSEKKVQLTVEPPSRLLLSRLIIRYLNITIDFYTYTDDLSLFRSMVHLIKSELKNRKKEKEKQNGSFWGFVSRTGSMNTTTTTTSTSTTTTTTSTKEKVSENSEERKQEKPDRSNPNKPNGSTSNFVVTVVVVLLAVAAAAIWFKRNK